MVPATAFAGLDSLKDEESISSVCCRKLPTNDYGKALTGDGICGPVT